ncbi:MAG: hypothetical protein HIU82_19480 [Proteobacteria bacterium]|nr:hypothetical protein [Pseudomonadota bacterium]
MAKVIADWDKQLAAQKLPKSALDAVRNYEVQLKPDKSYGVYVLCEPDGNGGGKAPFDAFVHANHQFPRSPNPTLRLVWNRLAPRYEGVSDQIHDHARILSTIVGDALHLSQNALKAAEVKMYLYNYADRAWGRRFAEALTGLPVPFNVSVKGGWLHLRWKAQGT